MVFVHNLDGTDITLYTEEKKEYRTLPLFTFITITNAPHRAGILEKNHGHSCLCGELNYGPLKYNSGAITFDRLSIARVQTHQITVYFYIKGACSDPQPHPPNFFQTYGDFGTRS